MTFPHPSMGQADVLRQARVLAKWRDQCTTSSRVPTATATATAHKAVSTTLVPRNVAGRLGHTTLRISDLDSRRKSRTLARSITTGLLKRFGDGRPADPVVGGAGGWGGLGGVRPPAVFGSTRPVSRSSVGVTSGAIPRYTDQRTFKAMFPNHQVTFPQSSVREADLLKWPRHRRVSPGCHRTGVLGHLGGTWSTPVDRQRPRHDRQTVAPFVRSTPYLRRRPDGDTRRSRSGMTGGRSPPRWVRSRRNSTRSAQKTTARRQRSGL